MSLKWIDSFDIAIELIEQFPDVDPESIRFTDLYDWVLALDTFDDEPNYCNERVLEAIQACWISEV